MTNVYITWTALKNKASADSLTIHYAEFDQKYQIYLLDGSDACMTYLPMQKLLDNPNFVSDNSSGLQTDLDDFEDNHKSSATSTEGVED